MSIEKTVEALPCIYRVLDNPEYAENFVKGRFRISTLQACRGYEGKAGDAQEGHLYRRIEKIILDKSNPQGIEAARQAGFTVRNDIIGSSIQNLTIANTSRDAYVLCLTEFHRPKDLEATFGNNWIRINAPILHFFTFLTQEMRSRGNIKHALLGRVQYKGRAVMNDELVTVDPSLLKPVDGYSEQKEIRMVWYMNELHVPMEPFNIECPILAACCERMPQTLDRTFKQTGKILENKDQGSLGSE